MQTLLIFYWICLFIPIRASLFGQYLQIYGSKTPGLVIVDIPHTDLQAPSKNESTIKEEEQDENGLGRPIDLREENENPKGLTFLTLSGNHTEADSSRLTHEEQVAYCKGRTNNTSTDLALGQSGKDELNKNVCNFVVDIDDHYVKYLRGDGEVSLENDKQLKLLKIQLLVIACNALQSNHTSKLPALENIVNVVPTNLCKFVVPLQYQKLMNLKEVDKLVRQNQLKKPQPRPQLIILTHDELRIACTAKEENKLGNLSIPEFKIKFLPSDICKYVNWYALPFGEDIAEVEQDEERKVDMNLQSESDNEISFFYNISAKYCIEKRCDRTTALQSKGLNFLTNEVLGHVTKIIFLKGEIPALYPSAISELLLLKHLEMDSVGLEVLEPNAFQHLPQLTYLSLQNNDLGLIEKDVFTSLKSLEDLHLEHNAIVAISSSSFSNMPNLKSLHLSYNKLTDYDYSWFKKTTSLTTLSFDHNEISKLPTHAFVNLNLKINVSINFDYNRIETLEPGMFDAAVNNRLWSFSLKHNNLACIEGDLKTFFMAEHVELEKNPFKCDCLQRIVDYTVYNNHQGVTFTKEKNCKLTSPAKIR